MSDSTEVSSVQQMMNSIYISLYEFQRYVCAYILNHRRSKIYDQSDVVGIGKSPIFNLYYSQVENMIASLLDLIRIVSCSLKYVGSCKDFFLLCTVPTKRQDYFGFFIWETRKTHHPLRMMWWHVRTVTLSHLELREVEQMSDQRYILNCKKLNRCRISMMWWKFKVADL